MKLYCTKCAKILIVDPKEEDRLHVLGSSHVGCPASPVGMWKVGEEDHFPEQGLLEHCRKRLRASLPCDVGLQATAVLLLDAQMERVVNQLTAIQLELVRQRRD